MWKTRIETFKEVSNKLYLYFVHKSSQSDGRKECCIDKIWKEKLRELSPTNTLIKITAPHLRPRVYCSKRQRFYESQQTKFKTYILDSKERDLIPRWLKQYKKERLEPILDYFEFATILHDAEVNNKEILGKPILINSLEEELTFEDLSETFVKKQLKNPEFVSEYMKKLGESNPQLAELMVSIHKHEGPYSWKEEKELSRKFSEAAFGSDKWDSH